MGLDQDYTQSSSPTSDVLYLDELRSDLVTSEILYPGTESFLIKVKRWSDSAQKQAVRGWQKSAKRSPSTDQSSRERSYSPDQPKTSRLWSDMYGSTTLISLSVAVGTQSVVLPRQMAVSLWISPNCGKSQLIQPQGRSLLKAAAYGQTLMENRPSMASLPWRVLSTIQASVG